MIKVVEAGWKRGRFDPWPSQVCATSALGFLKRPEDGLRLRCSAPGRRARHRRRRARASCTPRRGTERTTIMCGSTAASRAIASPTPSIPDGAYYPSVPLFAGLKVLETEGKKTGKFGPANGAVMEKLIEAGNLLARGRVDHSYPHSWRSKAPVIFRNTAQWFIRMGPVEIEGLAPLRARLDGGSATLRDKALAAIDATAFYPESGKSPAARHGRDTARLADLAPARLGYAFGHVRGQADRTSRSGMMPSTPASWRRSPPTGADAWYTADPADRFLGEDRNPAKDFEVRSSTFWMCGSIPAAPTPSPSNAARGGRTHRHWPADVYLEGSDQSRGWFQSSLLESCGTRERAPYQAPWSPAA